MNFEQFHKTNFDTSSSLPCLLYSSCTHTFDNIVSLGLRKEISIRIHHSSIKNIQATFWRTLFLCIYLYLRITTICHEFYFKKPYYLCNLLFPSSTIHSTLLQNHAFISYYIFLSCGAFSCFIQFNKHDVRMSIKIMKNLVHSRQQKQLSNAFLRSSLSWSIQNQVFTHILPTTLCTYDQNIFIDEIDTHIHIVFFFQ